jgi:hypothetical protein
VATDELRAPVDPARRSTFIGPSLDPAAPAVAPPSGEGGGINWMPAVVVGGGVLLIGGILAMAMKKKRPRLVTANRRRRRRRRR